MLYCHSDDLQGTFFYSGDWGAARCHTEDSLMSQTPLNFLFCGLGFFSWKYHSAMSHNEERVMKVVCWSLSVQRQSEMGKKGSNFQCFNIALICTCIQISSTVNILQKFWYKIFLQQVYNKLHKNRDSFFGYLIN